MPRCFFCYWLQHNFTQFLCLLFWKSNIVIKLHYQKVLLPFRVKISVKIQITTPLNEPNKQIRGQKINQLVTFANLSINLPDFKICQSIGWSDSQKVRQFSIVHLIPSFTLCRQRLILSTPHGVLKGFQIWSKIFCLLPLFFYSMFGRTAPWNCLRLDFQDKSVFFFFFCLFSFSFLHTLNY